MRLPRFDLKRVDSPAEAARLLRELGPSAALAAGGTELYPRMKYRLLRPEVVVSLRGAYPTKPDLHSDGVLCLDAMTRLSDLVRSDTVRRAAPLLCESAMWVGSNQIRNMATLGGNICQETRCLYFNQSHDFQFVEPCFKRGGDLCYLVPKGKKCWAVHMGDTAPALLSLDARAVITDGEREWERDIDDLFISDSARPLSLEPDHVLTRILVPPLGGPSGSAFGKLCPRGGLEFATVNVAIRLKTEEDRETCSSARIAVASVGPAPLRARRAEALLTGEKLTEELLRSAAKAAADQVRPSVRPDYSVSYLKKSLETLCLDVLREARSRVLAKKEGSGAGGGRP